MVYSYIERGTFQFANYLIKNSKYITRYSNKQISNTQLKYNNNIYIVANNNNTNTNINHNNMNHNNSMLSYFKYLN